MTSLQQHSGDPGCMLLQADCSETRQSFQMSLDLIGTAESGDTWSAPALHLLYLLRHMLHAGHLSHVLPALLRLQSNAQVCSDGYAHTIVCDYMVH